MARLAECNFEGFVIYDKCIVRGALMGFTGHLDAKVLSSRTFEISTH